LLAVGAVVFAEAPAQLHGVGLDEHAFDQQIEGGHIMRRSDLRLEQRPCAQGPEAVVHQGQRALKFLAQA